VKLTGETKKLAPKEQHPGNSQAKGPLNNNSGKQAKASPKEQISQVTQTDWVNKKSYYGSTKNSFI